MSLLCESCRFSGAAVEKPLALPQLQLVEKSVTFYVPSYSAVTCSVFAFGVQVYGLFWEMTSGCFPYSALSLVQHLIHVTSVYEVFERSSHVGTFVFQHNAWFDSGFLLMRQSTQALTGTGRFPWSCCSADHGDSTIAALERSDRCPCWFGHAGSLPRRGAEAVSHGPACLADHRDFAVEVRAGWSTFLGVLPPNSVHASSARMERHTRRTQGPNHNHHHHHHHNHQQPPQAQPGLCYFFCVQVVKPMVDMSLRGDHDGGARGGAVSAVFGCTGGMSSSRCGWPLQQPFITVMMSGLCRTSLLGATRLPGQGRRRKT